MLGKSQYGVFILEQSFQQVSTFGFLGLALLVGSGRGSSQTLLAKLLIEFLPVGKVADFASALPGVLIQTQQQFFHGSSPAGIRLNQGLEFSQQMRPTNGMLTISKGKVSAKAIMYCPASKMSQYTVLSRKAFCPR